MNLGRVIIALMLVIAPAKLILAADQADVIAATVQAEQSPPLELYQLPFSLRRELPPIKVTVRHAPSDPALRFVKINGERFVQGDQLEQGPKIVEIRTDGVILEFQGQRLIIR